jgi:outer membrane protein TolC
MHRSSLALLLVVAMPCTAFAQVGPTAAPDASSLPGVPSVTDPMLAPVPPPKRRLQSWEEAVDHLRTRSTNLKLAIDAVLQAEAQTTIALAQYLPSLGACAGGSSTYGCANGSYTHQLITHTVTAPPVAQLPTSSVLPVPNTFAGSMTLSQDIINFQEFDQIGINRIAEKAARQTVDDTKRTLELALATQVVAVVTAERMAELNRVGLKVALEQLMITRKKESLESATGLDIVRAQQNAANARASLVTGDETLRQARETLGLALGLSEEIGVSPNVRVDGFAADALRACSVVAEVDERPDIQSARTSLDVAKRNLRNVWFSFLPTLTGQASLSATSVPPAGYPNPTLSIQAVLTIPLWDGGTRLGNVKNARAAEDIARQNLEALRRAAIIQVEQAQRGIEVAETSLRVAREQRDLAAQNDDLTMKSWQRGIGTSVDLVTASEAHRQAELGLAVAEFGIVKARLAANLALATCPW